MQPKVGAIYSRYALPHGGLWYRGLKKGRPKKQNLFLIKNLFCFIWGKRSVACDIATPKSLMYRDKKIFLKKDKKLLTCPSDVL
jgi:hypothetical protein